MTCPAPLMAVCNIDEQVPYIDYNEFVAAGGSADDNCAIDEASFIFIDDVSDNNSCPEIITRTYQIADLCGNTITCTQTITIDDEIDPTITCPDALTAVCSIDEQAPYADYNEFVAAGGSADDNCAIDEASFTLIDEISDGNTCPEVVTRTYQIADLCGNTITCTQIITIDDEIDPTITCPEALTAVCDINEQDPYADYNLSLIHI